MEEETTSSDDQSEDIVAIRGVDDELENIAANVVEQLRIQHPLIYEQHNICQEMGSNQLKVFKKDMIQDMCDFFALKKHTLKALKNFVLCCPCRDNFQI